MSLIKSFQRENIKVIRYENGSYNDTTGLYEEGRKVSEEDFTVSVQPFKGNKLRNEIEGQRESEGIRIYSDEEIFTVRDSNANSKLADCVEWRGCSYQVQSVENWTLTDIPHYKSIAMKIEKSSSQRKVI